MSLNMQAATFTGPKIHLVKLEENLKSVGVGLFEAIITIHVTMSVPSACQQRLVKELRSLKKDPVENIVALPHSNNLLEWHYVITFNQGDFEGGIYHGRLFFPPEYPFKPPGIVMVTPNGRFATNTRLCLSISDFHPESWNPAWSVGTILIGLQSFMTDTEITSGAIRTSAAEKKRLAAESLAFNMKNPTFRKIFPEFVEKYKHRLKQQSNDSNNTNSKVEGTLPGAGQPQQHQRQQLPLQLHMQQQVQRRQWRDLKDKLTAVMGVVGMAVAAVGVAAVLAKTSSALGYFT